MEYTEQNVTKIYFIITNPIWTALGSSPGLFGKRPVTNHLNHGNITYAYTFTLLPLRYPVSDVSELIRTDISFNVQIICCWHIYYFQLVNNFVSQLMNYYKYGRKKYFKL
jgi:hypothetical protein